MGKWINNKDSKPQICGKESRAYDEDAIFANSDYVLIWSKRGYITIAYHCFTEHIWIADNDGTENGYYDDDEVL